MKNRILIVVEGGNISGIFCDKDQAIQVVDWDNVKAGEYESFEADFGYPVEIGTKLLDKALKEAQDEVSKLKRELGEMET